MRSYFQHRILASLLAVPLMTAAGFAQAVLVCQGGRGSFEARLHAGVTVSIGAPHAGGFAQRGCQAVLESKGQTLEVATGVAEIDADALDVDFGLGGTAAAFQIRNKTNDTAMSYVLYALKPRLRQVRVLTGGDYYMAADTDLDGRVEIWTSDAGVFDGLDGLRPVAFDFAPLVVLRFEQQKLVDVAAEFLPAFDKRIEEVRAKLDPAALQLFRQSDGRLASIRAEQLSQLHDLLTTKVKALEIISSYMWSGRMQEANKAIEELWPALDQERIRGVLVDLRARGLRAQVDAVSPGIQGKLRKMKIYQARPERDMGALPPSMSGTGRAGLTMVEMGERAVEEQVEVNPSTIEMDVPLPEDPEQARALPSRVKVRLLIDAAGKVRKFQALGDPVPELEAAWARWKFIPAYRSGHPVACWLDMKISPLR